MMIYGMDWDLNKRLKYHLFSSAKCRGFTAVYLYRKKIVFYSSFLQLISLSNNLSNLKFSLKNCGYIDIIIK